MLFPKASSRAKNKILQFLPLQMMARQPHGPVGLASVLYDNNSPTVNTELWVGCGRWLAAPALLWAPPASGLLLPGCLCPLSLTSASESWLSVQGLFLFLFPLSLALTVGVSQPWPPFLVSRCRNPSSLLASLHFGLNQSRSGPGTPRPPCPCPHLTWFPPFPHLASFTPSSGPDAAHLPSPPPPEPSRVPA